ncbi:MAG: response regulator transcription factor [Thermomicrobiales bacterium]|nr:response regulator transcription factor [Thermomicrobiales bacterium]MCO5217947.1 response regulator transcription factor [Thermomicrobiales bacterium]MCO5224226.1 response regulator transcription factor [Thermomicrobiales bacterium]
MLQNGLRQQGYLTEMCHTGKDALTWLEENEPDVIVLDRDLPEVHGDIVCRTLVAQGHPSRILMLTASGALDDLVHGFSLGADDYLAKPFSYLELLARIEALGRRPPERSSTTAAILEYSAIRIDTRKQTAECQGLPLHLTPKEYGVLRELVSVQGAFRTSIQLLDAVWDDPFDRTVDVVKVTIHSLRSKLDTRNRIQTVTGFGYRLI